MGCGWGRALWQLWHVRDYQSEGREWLARVLAAPGALTPTVARAEVLDGACELCELAVHQGEGALPGALAEESLAIYRALDDQRGIAWALCHLAMVANQAGDQARTEELGAEALTRARLAGERWVAAKALETLGLAAIERRDWPLARRPARRKVWRSSVRSGTTGPSPAHWNSSAGWRAFRAKPARPRTASRRR